MSTRESQQLLEERTKRILTYLRSDVRYDLRSLPRPFFLEFTGSPSSGKTTTITEIDKFLRRQGFRVWRPQEGAEVIRHIERTTPLYNVRTGLYALTILMDESVGHRYDVVLFDRCIFDAYCWMEYWYQKGMLDLAEKKMIQWFFSFKLWVENIDIAYFVVCDPEEAMRRELRIALSEKLGETTNPETVRLLVERYKQVYRILSPQHPQLQIINTTYLNEQQMVESIADDIITKLEQKIENAPK